MIIHGKGREKIEIACQLDRSYVAPDREFDDVDESIPRATASWRQRSSAQAKLGRCAVVDLETRIRGLCASARGCASIIFVSSTLVRQFIDMLSFPLRDAPNADGKAVPETLTFVLRLRG